MSMIVRFDLMIIEKFGEKSGFEVRWKPGRFDGRFIAHLFIFE